MLRSTNDLKNFVVGATDGEIGHVKDFFFDDERWVVRYLVVETGDWLSSRKVLISPIAISRPEWAERIMSVSITMEQVRNSPDVDTERPVSRQHEMAYIGYYGYPYYWGGAGLWGGGLYPDMMTLGYGGYGLPSAAQILDAETQARADAVRHESDDPHLRSCMTVAGYHIHAIDGDIGHVQGFLVEDGTWAIRYLIVDTSNWWLGHQVLIAPQWIKEVSWHEAAVSVDLTRQAVQDAPPYDSTLLLDRKQELHIYAHHRRAGYWANEMKVGEEVSRVHSQEKTS